MRLLDALTWPHGPARYLEAVAPSQRTSLGEVRAEVTAVRRQTADTVTLCLRADRSWAGFQAGQHVLLTVEIDGRRHTRCFSLAGPDGAGRRLELTMKAHPTSTVSRWLREHAAPGLVVGLSQAQGDFALAVDSDEARPIVLLSGGSGVTPVLSMLRSLCAAGHRGPVTYVHFARSADDVLYEAEARELAESHPNVRVDVRVDLFDGIAPGWSDADTYLCGPAGFMDAVTDAYEAAGALERLHVERFTLAPATAATTAGGSLRFATAGRTVESDGRSILEQAEAAGLAPASGCRMGICATCTRTLESGCVTDLRTGTVTDRPGTPVRICVSAPAGDATVDL